MPYHRLFILVVSLFLIISLKSKNNKESLFDVLFCKNIENIYIRFDNKWYLIPNYAIENAKYYQMIGNLPLNQYQISKKNNDVSIIDTGCSQEIGKYLRIYAMLYAPFIYMGLGEKLTKQDYEDVIRQLQLRGVKFDNNINIGLKRCAAKETSFSTTFEDNSLLSEDKKLKIHYLYDKENYVCSKKTTETIISPLKIIALASSFAIAALAIFCTSSIAKKIHA